MSATAPPINPEDEYYGSPAEGAAAAGSVDMTTTQTFSSAPVHRRAKVIYDYDAANESELSLLADEVSTMLYFTCLLSTTPCTLQCRLFSFFLFAVLLTLAGGNHLRLQYFLRINEDE